jgi:hypothetical protein
VPKVACCAGRFAFLGRDQKLIGLSGTQLQTSPSLTGDLARHRELEISVVQPLVYLAQDPAECPVDDRRFSDIPALHRELRVSCVKAMVRSSNGKSRERR